jgi:hypothetical protein
MCNDSGSYNAGGVPIGFHIQHLFQVFYYQWDAGVLAEVVDLVDAFRMVILQRCWWFSASRPGKGIFSWPAHMGLRPCAAHGGALFRSSIGSHPSWDGLRYVAHSGLGKNWRMFVGRGFSHDLIPAKSVRL